jgi:hypothetical protein
VRPIKRNAGRRLSSPLSPPLLARRGRSAAFAGRRHLRIAAQTALQKITLEGGFEVPASLPTDKMSRNPLT